jgi:hypothetical protein
VKPTSLLDAVVERLPSRKRAQWIESVPQGIRDELEQVKTQFNEGRISGATKTGLATAIVATLKTRGIDAGQCTIVRWLEKQ